MNIAQNVEIHFHQQEQASIFQESNVSGDEERMGEVAVFTFFALRVMGNLGVNATSDRLGSVLCNCVEIVPLFGSMPDNMGLQIIPYPGNQGRKRFLMNLRMTESSARFDMSSKGFGLFGVGLGYYAPVAVLALLRHFAEKRADDIVFRHALIVAAAKCGQVQMQREATITNQSNLALGIVAAACERIQPDGQAT